MTRIAGAAKTNEMSSGQRVQHTLCRLLLQNSAAAAHPLGE